MISKSRLTRILDRMKGVPILVVGDINIDRYIWGAVDRISPEAPVPVVQVSRIEDRLGCAGNVVRNLSNLGAAVTLLGYVGADEDGKTLLAELKRLKVISRGVFVDASKPTIVKTRVIAQTQQIVRIDREDCSGHRPAMAKKLIDALDASLSKSRAVIVSDYGKGAVEKFLLDKLARYHSSGALSLAKRPLVVDPHPLNYGTYRGMTIGKPNRREAEIASGIKINSVDDAMAAARIILERWHAEMMMVTLGEDGMVIVSRNANEGIHLETAAQHVFDVSGAGDTVTAVFAAALAVGAKPVEAGQLANLAAGIVVSEVGTVAITMEGLRGAVKHGL